MNRIRRAFNSSTIVFVAGLEVIFLVFILVCSSSVYAQTPTPTPTPGGTPTPAAVPFGTPGGYAFFFGAMALVGIWFILRPKKGNS